MDIFALFNSDLTTWLIPIALVILFSWEYISKFSKAVIAKTYTKTPLANKNQYDVTNNAFNELIVALRDEALLFKDKQVITECLTNVVDAHAKYNKFFDAAG